MMTFLVIVVLAVVLGLIIKSNRSSANSGQTQSKNGSSRSFLGGMMGAVTGLTHINPHSKMGATLIQLLIGGALAIPAFWAIPSMMLEYNPSTTPFETYVVSTIMVSIGAWGVIKAFEKSKIVSKDHGGHYIFMALMVIFMLWGAFIPPSAFDRFTGEPDVWVNPDRPGIAYWAPGYDRGTKLRPATREEAKKLDEMLRADNTIMNVARRWITKPLQSMEHSERVAEEQEARQRALKLQNERNQLMLKQKWFLHGLVLKSDGTTPEGEWKLIGKAKFRHFTTDRKVMDVYTKKDPKEKWSLAGVFDWTNGYEGTWDFGSPGLSGTWDGLYLDRDDKVYKSMLKTHEGRLIKIEVRGSTKR